MTDKTVIELGCDDFVPHVEVRGYRSSAPMALWTWQQVVSSMLEKRNEKALAWWVEDGCMMVEVETTGLMKKALA